MSETNSSASKWIPKPKPDIRLQKADEHDLPLMLAWRNNPLLFQGFYTQSRGNHLITWEEHLAWWKNRPSTWHTYIIMLTEGEYSRPIGVVNVGQIEHWSPELGVYLNPTDWRHGYAREALLQLVTLVKFTFHRDYCHTTILKSNIASIELFKSLGFSYMAEAREGEIWMTKAL